ncbi:MAG: PorT protein [Bacteroidetes bacterium HGW-Bacteroidetes-2]|jgi:hypothetical protein|nr:MAG: PorT protein [Bacteroidetes bacterium HGW-Bacteroidetes-2]
MRNFFSLLTFLFLLQSAQAQWFSKERLANIENFDKQRWTWGYFIGFNSYDFKFDYKNQTDNTDILVDAGGGFNVGLVGDLRLNDYFNLRLEPGLFFTERNLIFPNFEQEKDFLREVKSTYIHVPLVLKVSTKRHNNFKPFIVGGVSTSINLSSNEKSPEDNRVGTFRMTSKSYYYELGFGIDFYLFYFKFTPSIRGVFALNDELVRDADLNSPYTSNIDKMSTRGFYINFTFQ